MKWGISSHLHQYISLVQVCHSNLWPGVVMYLLLPGNKLIKAIMPKLKCSIAMTCLNGQLT